MRSFKTIYWGSDRSTEAVFEAVAELPPTEMISACMAVALHEDGVVLSRPKRGWGLVGGHREAGETAEQCMRREAMEEAMAELGELRLIGRWKIRKLFESTENAGYPQAAYQLLYVADVVKMHEFTPQLEIEERMIAPLAQVPDLHHNFADFEEVYEFIVDQTS